MPDHTRWESLFGDLAGELMAAESAQRAGEVADRSRRETGLLRLVDRLRGALGHEVRLSTVAVSVAGRVVDVGSDWLLLSESAGREALVPLAAVLWVAGLGTGSAYPGSEGPVAARLDLRYPLRRLARDRAAVVLTLVDGSTLAGTLDRVGADFVELAEHEPGEGRRAAAVRQVRTVRVGALAVVRSR